MTATISGQAVSRCGEVVIDVFANSQGIFLIESREIGKWLIGLFVPA